MNTKFSELNKYIERIKERYILTLSAYKIFYHFVELGKDKDNHYKNKINKNIDTLNNFIFFFFPIKEACRCYLLIELYKFFDKSKQSLTLSYILEYSKKNIEELTKKDFLIHHKERKIQPELFKDYKELSLSDIKKLEKEIDLNNCIIKKLKDYRDKYLAHDDTKKTEVEIPEKEIKKILKLINNFIKFYYLKINFGGISYINFKEKTIKEMSEVIKCLRECEKNRIKRIEQKYKINLNLRKE